MISKTYYVDKNGYLDLKDKLGNCKDVFLVELNGAKFTMKTDYFEAASIAFRFPEITKNWDVYLDWIRELSWLSEESIALFLYDYSKMLLNHLEDRKLIISEFEDVIISWWQKEVLECTWGVKTREFFVIITDGDPYT